MSVGLRRGLLAAAALLPALAYEARELRRGAEGWPYSRFLRLIPPVLFLGGIAAGNAVLIPHILHRVSVLVDDALAPLDNDQES